MAFIAVATVLCSVKLHYHTCETVMYLMLTDKRLQGVYVALDSRKNLGIIGPEIKFRFKEHSIKK